MDTLDGKYIGREREGKVWWGIHLKEGKALNSKTYFALAMSDLNF